MTRPPSGGKWTAGYGPRRNPITGTAETHHGLDINSADGLTLVAPEDGTLTHWGPVPGWAVHGNVAIITGGDGWVHWLSHTDALAPGRTVGDQLTEGDPVAIMGMTGQTNGLHVHWETRHNGDRLDPAAWLARTARTTDTPAQEGPAPMSLRLITSPFYRAAKQHVITNGLDAFPVDDAVAVGLRAGGVPFHAYGEDDGLNPQQAEDAFNAEITLVHRFAGNVNQATAERMAAVFGERLKP